MLFWKYRLSENHKRRRRRFHWRGIRMWATKPIPHMKKKNHDISSKWEFTAAAAHKQSAGLYSPQRIGTRWKWSCLGVWVIGMGGPMVGDGSDGSESSNDDVCWAGKGVVIPDYSPQWRTMKGWIILMFLHYRILKVWNPPPFCSFFKFPIYVT